MNLQSERELEVTREKLRILEEEYEAARQEPAPDEYIRDVELQSLKGLINQLKLKLKTTWVTHHGDTGNTEGFPTNLTLKLHPVLRSQECRLLRVLRASVVICLFTLRTQRRDHAVRVPRGRH